jgi:hypothetical protein
MCIELQISDYSLMQNLVQLFLIKFLLVKNVTFCFKKCAHDYHVASNGSKQVEYYSKCAAPHSFCYCFVSCTVAITHLPLVLN